MTGSRGDTPVVKHHDFPTQKIIPLVPAGQLPEFSIELDPVEETIESDWTDYLSVEGLRPLDDDGAGDALILHEETEPYGRTVAALGLAAVILLSALFTGHELARADHRQQTRLALLAEKTALKSKPTPTPEPTVSVTNTSAWFDTTANEPGDD